MNQCQAKLELHSFILLGLSHAVQMIFSLYSTNIKADEKESIFTVLFMHNSKEQQEQCILGRYI